MYFSKQQPLTNHSSKYRYSISKHPFNSAQQNRILQQKNNCACGGFCPACKETATIQTKPETRPENNQYEQEANRIADAVVKPLSEKNTSRKKPVSPLTISTLQREPVEKNEEELLPPELSPAKNNIPDTLDELPRNAQPLAENARAFFESRMGYNFSQVKIHTDASAARSAQSVNAHAYTTGNHIVFSP